LKKLFFFLFSVIKMTNNRTTVSRSKKQHAPCGEGDKKDERATEAGGLISNSAMKATLPWVNGDLIFGLYLIAWFSGLVFAVNRNSEGELWPPYLPFEERLVEMHTLKKSVGFANENYWIPALSTLVYFFVVFIGPKVMGSRSVAKQLKPILLVWNTFLFTASTWGAYRVAPASINFISARGIHAFLCEAGETWDREQAVESLMPRCRLMGPGCVWLFIFCVSKIPETVDTWFLVLAKKKVRFLHWYHHISVLWFCWINWAHYAVGGIAYAAMNLTVHSIMYFWYTLAAANGLLADGLKPGKLLSLLLTLLQIVQMLLGATVTFYIASVPIHECLNYFAVNLLGVVIYTSYLFLFVRFFYSAYCQRKLKKKKL